MNGVSPIVAVSASSPGITIVRKVGYATSTSAAQTRIVAACRLKFGAELQRHFLLHKEYSGLQQKYGKAHMYATNPLS